MAGSILFSQDVMSPFTDMSTGQRPRTPHYLHLPTLKTTSVEHWLSQQNAQHLTPHQPSYDMSGFDHSFAQSNQTADDVMHNGYTITTEHHDDYINHWPASHHSFTSPLGLQLDTQPIDQLSRQSSSPSWNDYAFGAAGDHNSSPVGYMLPTNYSPESTLSPFAISGSPLPQASPVSSEQSLSPSYPLSPHLPSPSTPGSTHRSYMPSPTPSDMSNMLLLDNQSPPNPDKPLFTHREQLIKFRDATLLPMDNAGPFVPQQMYKPHTTSDRKRYVEEVLLEAPLYFISEQSQQYGILLKDALQFRTKKLRDRDQVVFEGRGPSVSIRLEWPGYRQWSRQIPTKDFRSPPQPITLAKLAKNVAKCVQRFMSDRKNLPMEEDADPRWKIGDGPNDIKLEDLVLVSIHHVSLGSWQPQLRLLRPLRPRHIALPPTPMTATNTAPPMNFGGHL